MYAFRAQIFIIEKIVPLVFRASFLCSVYSCFRPDIKCLHETPVGVIVYFLLMVSTWCIVDKKRLDILGTFYNIVTDTANWHSVLPYFYLPQIS